MGRTDMFFSTPARVLTGAAAVAAALLVVSLAADLPGPDLVLAAALSGLGVLAVWAVLGRPSVEVSDGAVVLRNVLRTVTIPWPTLVRAEVGWSLVVHTTAGRWTAWAAPRSGGGARALAARGPGRWPAGSGEPDADRKLPEPPSDHDGPRRHRATAEAVAAAIDDRRRRLAAAGDLDGAREVAVAHGIRPTVTWHTGMLAAALGLAAVAAASRLV